MHMLHTAATGSAFSHAPCRSTLAQVLLVRYVAQVISESGTRQPGESGSFYDFLESCLRHKNDMVTVEAARAICNMKDVTTRELTPAVTVLQLMLSSSKPVIRYPSEQGAKATNKLDIQRECLHLSLEGMRSGLPSEECRPSLCQPWCSAWLT